MIGLIKIWMDNSDVEEDKWDIQRKRRTQGNNLRGKKLTFDLQREFNTQYGEEVTNHMVEHRLTYVGQLIYKSYLGVSLSLARFHI